MPDLSQRSSEIEIMDDLNCSGEVVHQTLRELENINYLLGGNHVTLDGVARLLRDRGVAGQPWQITDLGCGGGDMLKLIRGWANKKNIGLRLTGIDANPHIVSFAQTNTPLSCKIQYETVDIFSEKFRSRKMDIALGTLFFHHFTREQLIAFFAQLKMQTTIGFVVNDIHRHWFAYYSIRWLTSLFSKSAMVKYDAPLSVRRAFRKKELIDILEAAGIRDYSIRWMWAFRWQVIVFNNT
ncbi:MAG: methyltransferase domain-containing protein [Bacteroidota bacterium]